MKTGGNNGFSLIELLIGMLSAAALALVFSAVLIYGYRGWTRLKAEAAMESDADVAMRTMDRIGRGATNASWGGNTLTFWLTNGVTHTFSKPGNGANLLWNNSTLIANRVSIFLPEVAADGSIVAVHLRLVVGSETLDMPFSIFLRN